MTASECGLHKGTIVSYRELTGEVTLIEGNLCWTRYSDGTPVAPFIWRFGDQLNTMHNWPGKPPPPVLPDRSET